MPMKPRLSRPLALSSALVALACVDARAVSFDFSTASQYADNFSLGYMQTGSPSGTVSVNTTSGRLVHNAAGGSTATWIYDTTPSDGTTSITTFSDFTLDIDFSIAAGSGSFGVFFGGSSRTNSALALFNINNSGSNDQLRLFGPGADMTGAGVGSGNTAHSLVPTTNGYTSNTFYHLQLSVAYQTASSALVTFTISDPGNTLQSITLSGIVTGLSPSGEIAFRSYTGAAGSSNFDNLSITTSAVPEPSAFALVGGLAALGFVAVRRQVR